MRFDLIRKYFSLYAPANARVTPAQTRKSHCRHYVVVRIVNGAMVVFPCEIICRRRYEYWKKCGEYTSSAASLRMAHHAATHIHSAHGHIFAYFEFDRKEKPYNRQEWFDCMWSGEWVDLIESPHVTQWPCSWLQLWTIRMSDSKMKKETKWREEWWRESDVRVGKVWRNHGQNEGKETIRLESDSLRICSKTMSFRSFLYSIHSPIRSFSL